MVALVDQADASRVLAHRWYACVRASGTAYAVGRVAGKTTMLHRFLLNASAGEILDHINGDGLDNRRANLRFCTKTENNRNRAVNRCSRSGLKGVQFSAYRLATNRKPWVARIKTGGRVMKLGYFKTPAEAAAAYNAAAVRLFGSFARLNAVA